MAVEEPRSSVRIELDAPGSSETAAPAPAPPGRSTQPFAIVAMVAVLTSVVAGLFFFGGESEISDDVSEDEAAAVVEGDLPGFDGDGADAVWIGDVPLFGVLVDGVDGWYGVSGERLYTSDAPTGWERVDLGQAASLRVLDVSSSGDGVNVLVNDGPVGTDMSQIRVLRSSDGDAWTTLDEAAIPGFVHSGSLNATSWVVQAGPNEVPAPENASVLEQVEDRPYTAAPDGGSQRLRLGETDRVESYVAGLDGGFVVTSTVDPFSTPSGQDLPTRLLRVTGTETENVTPADAELAPADELIRSGDGTLWLISGLRAWSSVAPYVEWRLAADANELENVAEVRPALTGGGVIATTNSPGLEGFHFTKGNGIWEEFTFPGVSELGLLLVDGNNLMVSAVVDGTRQVTIARALTVVEQPQIQQTPINDGEWDLPLLAPALDGDSFAGLTNVNGAIGFFESADGLTWSNSELTDLPFGFFGTRLERIEEGFLVLGRVGLLEDAVFTSTDGRTWTRIGFDLPRGATAIEIESVSRTPRSTAVLGSLGWADDLSRTERLLLWWADGEQPIDVPFRPCPETQGICTLRSIAVVDDGVLATHLADQRFTVSKWTPDFGWEQLGVDQPLPEEPVQVRTTPAGVVYLGRDKVLGSVDNGVTWTRSFPAEGIQDVGPYQAISGDGTVALASGDGVLVVLDATGQRLYSATGVQFGEVLAVTRSAVIIRGITPDGAALVRLAAPGAAGEETRAESTLPIDGLIRTIALDPASDDGYLTVFDGRLHTSEDLNSWTPVSSQEVGSETVLDLSRKDGEITILLASPGLTPQGGAGTWVSVSRLLEDRWEWLATAPVPLEVTEGSLDGTEWVVRAGPPLATEDLGTADQLVNDLSSWLYSGSATTPTVVQVPMGASELSVQAVAVGTGAIYLSVELDFFVGSPPSLQLKRWTPGSDPVILRPGARSVTEGDSLWLSGDGMIGLQRDNESWAWSPDTENFVLLDE